MSPGAPAPTTRRAIRVSEFAAMLSLPLSTAYDVVRKQEVEVIRIGGAIRIPVGEAERFIRENTRPARGNGAGRP